MSVRREEAVYDIQEEGMCTTLNLMSGHYHNTLVIRCSSIIIGFNLNLDKKRGAKKKLRG